MKQAKSCEMWAHDIYTRGVAAFVASVPIFCATSKKALLKKGHDPRDVGRAQDDFESVMTQSTYPNLSDPVLSPSKLWKYLPVLDLYVGDCKRYRLSDELAQRVSKRQGVIRAFYWKTIKTFLTSDKRPYLPGSEKLHNLRFFADYINDPKESVVEFNTYYAHQEILQFFDAYEKTKKQRILKVLLNTGFLPIGATESSNPDDFLGLAIAVFECCHASVFVGWEDAGIHLACLHMPPFLPSRIDTAAYIHFSDIGYQALKNLASLLHLDLRSALAKDFDALNKRFICKTCKFHRQGGLHGHHSMTWRECLNHAKLMWSVSSDSDSERSHVIMFDVLSEALTTSILALEQPFPPPADANWTCKHCYIWFEPGKRAEVVDHAKTVHGVMKPVEGVDIIYCHTEKSPKRTTLFVGLDKHSNHRCLRCPSPKGLRLWKKIPDLHRHIFDKHAIQSKDLIEGVDLIKVEAVQDDYWIKEKMRAEGITLA
ncbi:hypothetical protein BJ912DRAFT_306368 [Pholiota molesta]|nr:hypothetical protein BJ912DRAFT_306368 [Pholiota molesta]